MHLFGVKGLRLVGLGLTACALVACGSDDSDSPGAAAATPAHWEYEGDDGPAHWGDLSPEFSTCETGSQQSPINIPASVPAGPLSALTFRYSATRGTIVDNGHTVQINLEEGNELTVGSDTYSLVQFHFHAHSEHTIAGSSKPLEMHLVHRSASGGLAVVGVMIETGTTNAALSSVFDTMGTATADPEDLSSDVDPGALLPASKNGWTYSGSLTTPPCTEGVKWHVLSEPIQVSSAQLAAFTANHSVSFRPTMSNTSTVTSGD